MTKITIELGPGDSQSASVPPGVSVAHTGVPAASEAPGGATPPADLLTQAAAAGAINGGPGPSSIGAAGASAPIASSIPGVSTASHDVVAAGPAPQHLFVSKHSTQ